MHFPFLSDGIRVIPLQLFESGLYLILFIVQLLLWKRIAEPNVHIHTLLIGFATIRFVTEYMRPDATWLLPFLSVTQLLCIAVVLCTGMIEYFWRKQKHSQKIEDSEKINLKQ
jgi:prolipoprotein diacylglyceryltransferase